MPDDEIVFSGSGDQSGASGVVTKKTQSLRDVLDLSSNQKCTFVDGETSTSGTIYAGRGKVRGDFIIDNQEQNLKYDYHVITDRIDLYYWGGGRDRGAIIDFETATELALRFSTQQGEGESVVRPLNPDKLLEVVCEQWETDATLFSPPPEIEFVEIDETDLAE